MSQVRDKLETIRQEYLACSSPKASVPSGPHDVDGISVQFSVEQMLVIAESLGTDLSRSSNVIPSLRSLIVSLSSDAVDRKLQSLGGDGVAADAAGDAN
jgi:hypothetical protein